MATFELPGHLNGAIDYVQSTQPSIPARRGRVWIEISNGDIVDIHVSLDEAWVTLS